jgi:hypothetical protein
VERSTATAESAGVVVSVRGLLDWLAALPDGRRARGKRYPLPLLLLLIVLAKLAGEVVYGLTSLPATAASAAELLRLHRAHWGIENGLHHRRDVTFHEDATRLTKGNAGRVMATLNNLSIGLLRRAGYTNLAAARRHCAADLSLSLTLLSLAPRT